MGFGSFVKAIANPINAIAGSSAKAFGGNPISAVMSGLPFVGEGFAAQQQQQFESGEASTARDFNAQQAFLNRQWQESMSNTAHQRQVKDLKKAGLNPILSAGAGASSPSGATASGSGAKGVAMSGGKSSADQVRDILNMTRKQAEANIAKTNQEKDTSKAIEIHNNAMAKATVNSAKKLKAEAKAVEMDNVGRANEAKVQSQIGTELKYLQHLAPHAKGGWSLMKMIKNWVKPNKVKTPKARRKVEKYGNQGEHKGTTITTDW
jgi:hypothetical protein